MSSVIIYGGGTFSHVRSYLSLAAVAFGTTARSLHDQIPHSELVLTKMADPQSDIVTYLDMVQDVRKRLDNPMTKVIIMNAAICDFEGTIEDVESGVHAERLQTSAGTSWIEINPVPKILDIIKSQRPDITVIGFKTTTDNRIQDMIDKGHKQGSDMVLVNDVVTRRNILLEGDRIHGDDRDVLLSSMASFAKLKGAGVLKEIDNGWYVRFKPLSKYTRQDAYSRCIDELDALGIKNYSSHSCWPSAEHNVMFISKVKK